MAEWLTIKQVSEKHGIPESTLRCWKDLNYIASSLISIYGCTLTLGHKKRSTAVLQPLLTLNLIL